MRIPITTFTGYYSCSLVVANEELPGALLRPAAAPAQELCRISMEQLELFGVCIEDNSSCLLLIGLLRLSATRSSRELNTFNRPSPSPKVEVLVFFNAIRAAVHDQHNIFC